MDIKVVVADYKIKISFLSITYTFLNVKTNRSVIKVVNCYSLTGSNTIQILTIQVSTIQILKKFKNTLFKKKVKIWKERN